MLINGRRLNDIDMAGVDFSTIPRDSIERIEITKGNSGAVLYGDNAVGGVINIVLKNGVGGPPVKMRAEAGVGSFNSRMASVSVATNYGPWSTSFYGNGIKSDGYRVNNALDQRNGVGNLNYTTPGLTAFVTLSGDDQKLGFPGGRLVDPSIGLNELVTNRRGTSHAVRLRQPAGRQRHRRLHQDPDERRRPHRRWRRAGQEAAGRILRSRFGNSYVDAHLQTWSITPRLSIKNVMFGMPSAILTGIDYYDATFHQERPTDKGVPPIHTYDLSQQTLAGYWQHTIGLLPTTDFSYGARVQNTTPECQGHRSTTPELRRSSSAAARRPAAGQPAKPNTRCMSASSIASTMCSRCSAAPPARSARPNVDERAIVGPCLRCLLQSASPATSQLKTQTSHDIEGGFRIKSGGFQMQSSIYNMDLENEIHFIPALFYNVNLDPTRRYGSETSASLRLSDSVLLRGGMAYTRAVFREGAFAGKDVPLVSRYTASGGVTWNIWQKYLVADATVRVWSERFMDNDQANTQRRIPANATVDFKLSGEYGHFFWSLSANNLLNALYYDYAIASTLHRRPLQRLSAAGPDLHGEGRRDVLTSSPSPRLRGEVSKSRTACPDRHQAIFSRLKCRGNIAR